MLGAEALRASRIAADDSSGVQRQAEVEQGLGDEEDDALGDGVPDTLAHQRRPRLQRLDYGVEDEQRALAIEDLETEVAIQGVASDGGSKTIPRFCFAEAHHGLGSGLQGYGVTPVCSGPVTELGDASFVQPRRGGCEAVALQEARGDVTEDAPIQSFGAAQLL